MTDDTLREECEKLLSVIDLHQYQEPVIDKLLAFAHAQQAKWLREAAAMAKDYALLEYPARDEFESGYENGCVSVSLRLDAQATAREAEHQPPARS